MVEGSPFIPAAPAVVPPTVSSAVSHVYVGVAEVQVVAPRIARVYGEVPYARRPVQWAVEVCCSAESPVLPV